MSIHLLLFFFQKTQKRSSQSHLKRAKYPFQGLRKSEECTEVTENKCGSKEIQKFTQKGPKKSLKIKQSKNHIYLASQKCGSPLLILKK